MLFVAEKSFGLHSGGFLIGCGIISFSPAMPQPEPFHEFQARAAHYQEFLAEREEILRHKWFLGQRDGREFSWEEALLDWVGTRRSAWKKERTKRVSH
jgi:hypothetical protein